MLWPDTFNNYFHPETARSVVSVVEAAGFEVLIPRKHLCCGRPLYDYGLLDRARDYLTEILDELGPLLQAGVPAIGLEPSCLAVFRDELTSMLPYNQNAQRLRQQSYTFAGFLNHHAADFHLPPLERQAVMATDPGVNSKVMTAGDAIQQALQEQHLGPEADADAVRKWVEWKFPRFTLEENYEEQVETERQKVKGAQ